ncbi:hypothetical protein C5L25_002223 [Secundilactobacillus silagei JCM 19001]|uniref:Uncharacterized protein n=1 Tax=Secundilactobacillus silagei JCM 19001 TaxID=1302250 RepID=A0A1Z5IF85_9LACO|nr:hypothetical protein C5L25_002223 [Secundilactobacillus silagei JCM 19001]GAX00445.1 hypothetical protein IWT126_00460 [Secundilactobacillus silagei JCM 19001]
MVLSFFVGCLAYKARDSAKKLSFIYNGIVVLADKFIEKIRDMTL